LHKCDYNRVANIAECQRLQEKQLVPESKEALFPCARRHSCSRGSTDIRFVWDRVELHVSAQCVARFYRPEYNTAATISLEQSSRSVYHAPLVCALTKTTADLLYLVRFWFDYSKYLTTNIVVQIIKCEVDFTLITW